MVFNPGFLKYDLLLFLFTLYSMSLKFLISDGYDTAQETSNSQQYGWKLYLRKTKNKTLIYSLDVYLKQGCWYFSLECTEVYLPKMSV